ncbi:hypothetical protein [Levilactobacillus namurensis]|uniref:Uncharacterized protein n=1 Tax=Levilactobacillus namurensis TaxID=380393 RepID=A0AAW8W3X8_9LACO|nr:hypothetical protein [Levilactobacillus namurensis]MDT7013494.1 hypothetical protein [Levilactobacillus namurensis]
MAQSQASDASTSLHDASEASASAAMSASTAPRIIPLMPRPVGHRNE